MARALPFAALLVLLVGGVGAWWILNERGASEPDEPLEEMIELPGGPDLTGRADPESDAAGAAPPSDAGAAPGRRWELHVHLHRYDIPREYMMTRFGEVERPEVSDFDGHAIRAELVLWERRTTIASAELDEHGDAVLDVSEVESLSPLERANASIVVVPEADLDFGPNPPLFYTQSNTGTRTLLPIRPETDPVVIELLVPVLPDELIRGEVVLEDEPVGDAHVWLYSSDGSAGEDCTDADGRFAIRVTEGGTFTLYASSPGNLSGSRSDLRLTTASSADLGSIELEPVGDIAGVVRYADGSPVRGITVDLSDFDISGSRFPPSVTCDPYDDTVHVTTNGKGRFRARVGHGSWHVSVDVPGPLSARSKNKSAFSIEPGTDDLEFTIDGHRFKLRVIDPEGHAIPNVRIDARSETDKGNQTWNLQTDREGRADLWVPHGAKVALSVVARGAAPLTERVVAPAKGNESSHTIRVEPLTLEQGIEVALDDPEGRSVLPALVKVHTNTGSKIWERRVDEAGYFLGLAPGTYRVAIDSIETRDDSRIHSDRWLEWTTEVEVVEGETTEVRGVVTAAAYIDVVLTGKPDGERIWYDDPDVNLVDVATGRTRRGWLWNWTWDEPARVREALPAGTYEVRVEMDGFHPVVGRVTVDAGEAARMEFALEAKDSDR